MDVIKVGKEMEVFGVMFDSVVLFVKSVVAVFINVLNSIDEFVVTKDDNIVVSVVAGFDELVVVFV